MKFFKVSSVIRGVSPQRIITCPLKFSKEGQTIETAWPVPNWGVWRTVLAFSYSFWTYSVTSSAWCPTITNDSLTIFFTLSKTYPSKGFSKILGKTFGVFYFIRVPLPAAKITALISIYSLLLI